MTFCMYMVQISDKNVPGVIEQKLYFSEAEFALQLKNILDSETYVVHEIIKKYNESMFALYKSEQRKQMEREIPDIEHSEEVNDGFDDDLEQYSEKLSPTYQLVDETNPCTFDQMIEKYANICLKLTEFDKEIIKRLNYGG